MKPHVFIGSSSEGLSVAYALQNNLENDAEVTVWTQDVFRPSEYVLESLLKQLVIADVGLFVFSPDDLVRIRGVEQNTVRDNVVFEFGLFVGHLGRDHSLIVAPRGGNPRLPSDLLGVNVLLYNAERSDGNLDAALGPASNRIRGVLKSVQPKAYRVPTELDLPFLERRDLLSATQRGILQEIESVDAYCVRDLAARFHNMSMSELHYRLEQLRLLMFIEFDYEAAQTDPAAAAYMLTAVYRQALESRRNGMLPTYR